MAARIVYVTLLVRDQEEALRFYTEMLGWEKREDNSTFDPTTRWLTVAPPGQTSVVFLLRKASGAELERVGCQTGGEFMCVLTVDDCQEVYEALQSRGVVFTKPPTPGPFGITTTFEDLYGNLIDLWEPHL